MTLVLTHPARQSGPPALSAKRANKKKPKQRELKRGSRSVLFGAPRRCQLNCPQSMAAPLVTSCLHFQPGRSFSALRSGFVQLTKAAESWSRGQGCQCVCACGGEQRQAKPRSSCGSRCQPLTQGDKLILSKHIHDTHTHTHSRQHSAQNYYSLQPR